jgi:hypothetical protein
LYSDYYTCKKATRKEISAKKWTHSLRLYTVAARMNRPMHPAATLSWALSYHEKGINIKKLVVFTTGGGGAPSGNPKAGCPASV